ncbi:hypothetical protein lerEdw1_007233 [Lerista edwardsae]|nr:hypothetical protein lerEdw1_007233 [Lerista edwardsae]
MSSHMHSSPGSSSSGGLCTCVSGEQSSKKGGSRNRPGDFLAELPAEPMEKAPGQQAGGHCSGRTRAGGCPDLWSPRTPHNLPRAAAEALLVGSGWRSSLGCQLSLGRCFPQEQPRAKEDVGQLLSGVDGKEKGPGLLGKKYPVISRRASVLERWKRQVNVPFVIHVFRNGDLLSPAFRLVLPKSVLQEWSTVLHLLSEKANLRSGAVRKLCKLNGDVVSSAEELLSGHYYVAVGLERYRSLPYFELLAPKKTAPRPLRLRVDFYLLCEKHHGEQCGTCQEQVHLLSQDGASDSVLLEPLPRVDCRRAQSTGTAEKENRPSSPLARPKQARKHPHRDGGKSVFHAKPVCAGPKNLNLQQGSDKGRSVYRTKSARREMQGAQEVGEDEDTQVDLPIDQKTAEIVEEEEEEEGVPRIKQLPRKGAGLAQTLAKEALPMPLDHPGGTWVAVQLQGPSEQGLTPGGACSCPLAESSCLTVAGLGLPSSEGAAGKSRCSGQADQSTPGQTEEQQLRSAAGLVSVCQPCRQKRTVGLPLTAALLSPHRFVLSLH